MTINVKLLHPKAMLPRRATLGSVGYDLHACIDGPSIPLEPGAIATIGTGLAIELPTAIEAQIRPRSGLAFNHGITVLNSPGTIDPDYRGEIRVMLINHSTTASHTIHHGDRIAQMVFCRVEMPELSLSSDLDRTDRGFGGFGSTGS